MVSAETTALDPDLASEQALRVPCYCEENVWRLAYRRLYYNRHADDDGDSQTENDAPTKEYHVVFISNKRKCCPIFHQRAKEDGPCFWDYHVILLVTCSDRQDPRNESTFVLDMDSRLPYPCTISTYLEDSFDLEYDSKEEMGQFAPCFRIIPAAVYLNHFFSDRMHMFDREKLTWSSPPPAYDCIMTGWDGKHTRTSNLDQYISMERQSHNEEESVFGCVRTLEEMKHEFCRLERRTR